MALSSLNLLGPLQKKNCSLSFKSTGTPINLRPIKWNLIFCDTSGIKRFTVGVHKNQFQTGIRSHKLEIGSHKNVQPSESCKCGTKGRCASSELSTPRYMLSAVSPWLVFVANMIRSLQLWPMLWELHSLNWRWHLNYIAGLSFLLPCL